MYSSTQINIVSDKEIGFRAMLNTLGSLSGAHVTGILDVTTYIAGISGLIISGAIPCPG